MIHYLAYWKPKNADYSDHSYGGLLLHAVSAYYEKVRKGDTVWIVTSKTGVFSLLGPIVVNEITGTREAERRLGMSDLYDADFHIFPADGTAAKMKWIDVTTELPKLWFSGTKNNRLLPGWSAGNLQAMRKLTDGSGKMLQRIYEGASVT